MEDLRIDHVSPHGVFATLGNVFLWRWSRTATPLTCQRLRVQLVAHCKAHPEGAGALTIIGRGVGIPSDEVRREIVKARLEAAQYAMRAGAILYLGDGLQRSVARGVVTGLMLLARNIYPQSVFGEVDPALAWLEEKVGPGLPSRAELTRAVADLRAVSLPGKT